MTISGLVSGSGNLTKDGSGILTLSRTDNTFNGTVTILNGKI
jgi:autotransporter-associated beta strand protein